MTLASSSPSSQRPLASRALHSVGELSQSSAASMVAALISIGFLAAALLAPRAAPLLSAFEALAAAVTLVMVFALQHTQSRQQAAIQRKLDEILRALPGADNRLLRVETASETELAALGEQHAHVRHQAIMTGAEDTDRAR